MRRWAKQKRGTQAGDHNVKGGRRTEDILCTDGGQGWCACRPEEGDTGRAGALEIQRRDEEHQSAMGGGATERQWWGASSLRAKYYGGTGEIVRACRRERATARELLRYGGGRGGHGVSGLSRGVLFASPESESLLVLFLFECGLINLKVSPEGGTRPSCLTLSM